MSNSKAKKLNERDLEFYIPQTKIRELKANTSRFKIVGQDRAVEAIELGLGIDDKGYNIFVMGTPGTGRSTVISSLLKNYTPDIKKIQDIAYAYNFCKFSEPEALFFPAGKGRSFKLALKKGVENIHIKTVEFLKADKNLNEETRAKIILIIKKELLPVEKLVISYNTKQNENQKKNIEKILNFLKKVERDLILKMHLYSSEFKSIKAKKNFFGRYLINLICEYNPKKNYVITENLPSFSNLFGCIESGSDSDFNELNGHLKIKAGAIHRAIGGYLILKFEDLVEEDDSWIHLKRILQSEKIEIQSPPSSSQSVASLKPEALPVNFKVIIIGGEFSYELLYQEDPDFCKLFKVCAEFDLSMKNIDRNIAELISFVDYLSTKKKLRKFTNSGYEYLIGYASRIAESRLLLTTQFNKISDLIIEANFYAGQKNQKTINDEILNYTIEQRNFFHSLPEDKFSEMIKFGDILISVSGSQIAKINGLAIEERGFYSFGLPVTVTAQASPGDGGIVNIEREAGLSGEIYDKAHLIITSLLREKFAKTTPLSISASICFEQSYSYIDGDSASCAEFLALISAIGNFPMRQDIAVTGSLNQYGVVQSVGGISEKIEGFFKVCKSFGFTGTQGVMIPFSNKNNLFLSKEIIEAVKAGLFNVWAINHIDEGIKLLSNLEEKVYCEKISTKLSEFYKLVKKS